MVEAPHEDPGADTSDERNPMEENPLLRTHPPGPLDQNASPYSREGETTAERIDRNWNEMLQELRVAQTGVQILSGFLLTLPFQ